MKLYSDFFMNMVFMIFLILNVSLKNFFNFLKLFPIKKNILFFVQIKVKNGRNIPYY